MADLKRRFSLRFAVSEEGNDEGGGVEAALGTHEGNLHSLMVFLMTIVPGMVLRAEDHRVKAQQGAPPEGGTPNGSDPSKLPA